MGSCGAQGAAESESALSSSKTAGKRSSSGVADGDGSGPDTWRNDSHAVPHGTRSYLLFLGFRYLLHSPRRNRGAGNYLSSCQCQGDFTGVRGCVRGGQAAGCSTSAKRTCTGSRGKDRSLTAQKNTGILHSGIWTAI